MWHYIGVVAQQHGARSYNAVRAMETSSNSVVQRFGDPPRNVIQGVANTRERRVMEEAPQHHRAHSEEQLPMSA